MRLILILRLPLLRNAVKLFIAFLLILFFLPVLVHTITSLIECPADTGCIHGFGEKKRTVRGCLLSFQSSYCIPFYRPCFLQYHSNIDRRCIRIVICFASAETDTVFIEFCSYTALLCINFSCLRILSMKGRSRRRLTLPGTYPQAPVSKSRKY